MSNLFKQYNIVESKTNTRVMDYNAIIEEKLAKLAKQQNAAKKGEDGFTELELETVEIPAQEDPSELLKKAEEQAQEVLRQANERSESLLAEAQEKSKDLFAQAKADGERQGYEEGVRRAKEELEAEYLQKEEALKQRKQSLEEEYGGKLKELEPQLLDVIVTVVEKVFHIQFEDKKEILLYLVGNTIANIEGCKSFRIRVGESRKEFLESRRTEILDRIGHDMSLEIVSDSSLTGNQCTIETDTGIFDCSMDVQLKNLIKDLRSLSS